MCRFYVDIEIDSEMADYINWGPVLGCPTNMRDPIPT